MNDTLIFLVLAGIALIFKWLTSQASTDSEKPEPPAPNERPRRATPETEEERVRRFLEALGAPPGTAPPPPVRPRTVTPRRVVTPAPNAPPRKPRRSWAQPLPPLVTTPEDKPFPALTTILPPSPVVVPAAPPPSPMPDVGPRPLVRPSRAPVPVSAATTSLGGLLRSRGSARQAIILREILGPPRGLQALDDLRSF